MTSQAVATTSSKTTGHDTYKPRSPKSKEGTVYCNNQLVIVEDDEWQPHVGDPKGRGDPHPGEDFHKTGVGSGTVFIGGKSVARIGDPVEDDTIASGSNNVFIG